MITKEQTMCIRRTVRLKQVPNLLRPYDLTPTQLSVTLILPTKTEPVLYKSRH